jgi:hypothetical protein
MKGSKFKFSWVFLMAAAGVMALTGCMTATPTPGETFSCAKASAIHKEIAPEASLEDFSCVVKPYEGADSLHFNVAVKNISAKDQRFRVQIFLSNGKAVGGLIPEKTKDGLVKPGQTAKFTYPVTGMNHSPERIDLFIKTMAQE